MTHRTLMLLTICGAGIFSACDDSGSSQPKSHYAASRPTGVPDSQPEIGPKPHKGPNLARQPEAATRPAAKGPFPMPNVEGKVVELPDGLKYIDLAEGTGPEPRAHQTVWVDYTGWLEDGTMFDTSRNKAIPFHFWLGEKHVIDGWDEGIATMKVGGKRRLIVPPSLGYGGMAQDNIPPNSTLVFDVELLTVTDD